MRFVVVPALALALVGCGPSQPTATPAGHAHGSAQKPGQTHAPGDDEHAGHKAVLGPIELQTRDGLKAGAPVQLRFTIPNGQGVPIREFAVSHDAKVHFILIRQGLDTFAHLHPGVDPATGTLSAEYTFPTGGM